MLNNDTLRLLYEECCLESCLALGEVCKASSEVLASLDKSLIMRKVQDRAPWLELSNEYLSWTKCARVLIARSKKAQDGKYDKLKIITDLRQVDSESSIDLVSVEPTDVGRDDTLRRAMKPLFPYSRLQNLLKQQQSVVEGTKVLCELQELDLTTMTLKVSDYDPEDKLYAERNRKPVSTAPSGLKVRHSEGQDVEVVAENKTMLQVQYYVGDTETEFDEIVHKASQPRDEDGTLVIDPHMKAPRIEANFNVDMGMVNLVPGSGGALVIQHFVLNPEKSYLGYIEPSSERRVVELCKIPPQVQTQGIGFHQGNQWFYVLYDGFIYIYLYGRFLQLWIDLGAGQNRALTVWNADFPAIGPFGHFRDQRATWNITQGGLNDDQRRFVTIEDEPCGCVVGDLHTGKTYYSRGSYKSPKLTIPFATESQTVGFYVFDEQIWEFIDNTMDSLYGTATNYDISLLYAAFLETHHKMLGLIETDEEPSKETLEKELREHVCCFPRDDSDYGDYEDEDGQEEELLEMLDDLEERVENLTI